MLEGMTATKQSLLLLVSLFNLVINKHTFSVAAFVVEGIMAGHNSADAEMSRARRLVEHNRAMETGESPIVQTKEYHDKSLLRHAWDISPYNKEKSPLVRDDDDNILPEIINKAMCFQPREGFCGMATVNTMLRSLDPPLVIPYPPHGRGYSLVSLAELLIMTCSSFLSVEVIPMKEETTLDEFRRLLKDANSPQYRLLANFHRTPLFFSENTSSWEQARRRAYAGHWSPVGAALIVNDDNHQGKEDEPNDGQEGNKEYVMVLDTNAKYGPFVVALDRFFKAVKTQTLEDGYRGLIKVRLKNSSDDDKKEKKLNKQSGKRTKRSDGA